MLPEVQTRIQEIVCDKQKAQAIMNILVEAEGEVRRLRSQKQLDGIDAAKKRGVQFGRPLMELPKNFSKIYKKQCQGTLTVTEASRVLNISRQQFYRLRKRYEEQQEHL